MRILLLLVALTVATAQLTATTPALCDGSQTLAWKHSAFLVAPDYNTTRVLFYNIFPTQTISSIRVHWLDVVGMDATGAAAANTSAELTPLYQGEQFGVSIWSTDLPWSYSVFNADDEERDPPATEGFEIDGAEDPNAGYNLQLLAEPQRIRLLHPDFKIYFEVSSGAGSCNTQNYNVSVPYISESDLKIRENTDRLKSIFSQTQPDEPEQPAVGEFAEPANENELSVALLESKLVGAKAVFLPADKVWKVMLERSDLSVKQDDVILTPGLGLMSAAAFAYTEDNETETRIGGRTMWCTGEIVTTSPQLGQVVDAILTSGMSVTAIHDHHLLETPRLAYVHFTGMGVRDDLVAAVERAMTTSIEALTLPIGVPPSDILPGGEASSTGAAPIAAPETPAAPAPETPAEQAPATAGSEQPAETPAAPVEILYQYVNGELVPIGSVPTTVIPADAFVPAPLVPVDAAAPAAPVDAAAPVDNSAAPGSTPAPQTPAPQAPTDTSVPAAPASGSEGVVGGVIVDNSDLGPVSPGNNNDPIPINQGPGAVAPQNPIYAPSPGVNQQLAPTSTNGPDDNPENPEDVYIKVNGQVIRVGQQTNPDGSAFVSSAPAASGNSAAAATPSTEGQVQGSSTPAPADNSAPAAPSTDGQGVVGGVIVDNSDLPPVSPGNNNDPIPINQGPGAVAPQNPIYAASPGVNQQLAPTSTNGPDDNPGVPALEYVKINGQVIHVSALPAAGSASGDSSAAAPAAPSTEGQVSNDGSNAPSTNGQSNPAAQDDNPNFVGTKENGVATVTFVPEEKTGASLEAGEADVISTTVATTGATASATYYLDTPLIDNVLGVQGLFYATGDYTVETNRPVCLNGRRINGAQGAGSRITFNANAASGNRPESAAIINSVVSGQIACLEHEVDEVLRIFRSFLVAAPAVVTHFLGESPKLYFVHFYAQGPTSKLASVIRQVLDVTSLNTLKPRALTGSNPCSASDVVVLSEVIPQTALTIEAEQNPQPATGA